MTTLLLQFKTDTTSRIDKQNNFAISGENEDVSPDPLKTVFNMAELTGENEFNFHFKKWKEERYSMSLMSKMALCKSYQRIIGMGLPVVPVILRQLEKERDRPDNWFWALKSITGENPVKETSKGDMKKMAHDWIAWGKTQGYEW